MSLEISSKKLSQTQNINLLEEKTNQKTCNHKQIFGFKGVCLGGPTLQKKIMNLQMPSGSPMLQDIWDDAVVPVMSRVNLFPTLASGCIGDFSTDRLLSIKESKDARCANFPIPEGEKLSAVAFHINKLNCGLPDPNADDPEKPTDVRIDVCTVFDKCGTFGVSISGGVAECYMHKTGYLQMLAPAAKATKFAQFGYSPNRMWTATLQFLDPKNNMNIKTVNIRTHVYMGCAFGIPEIGIKFRGEDISKMVALGITGKAFIDFGDKNDFNPTNMRNLINDSSLSVGQKTLRFLQTAREYTVSARGSLSLKFAKKTSGFVPDLKIMDEMDYSLLINLGKGADGDRGSSGMPAGIHIFMKPPPMGILGSFIKQIVKGISKLMKCGGIPVPKLPNLNNVQMGFTIGEQIGFKIKIGSFEYQCMLRFKGKLAISCKTKLGFLSIFKDEFKWVAKQGKALFDASEAAFMAFAASPAGEFAADIGKGAIKFMGDLVGGAKVALEAAKKTYEAAKKKVENAKKGINNAAKKAEKLLGDASKALGNTLKNIDDEVGKWMSGALKNALKGLKCGKKCRRKKRDRKRKEATDRKEKEIAAAEVADAKKYKEIKEQENREKDAARQEVANAEREEKIAQDDEVNKNGALSIALQRQQDLLADD